MLTSLRYQRRALSQRRTSGDETDQTADSDTDLDTTADDTAIEALDPDEIEELSDVECDDDDIDAGETEENNHDGMYDEIV